MNKTFKKVVACTSVITLSVCSVLGFGLLADEGETTYAKVKPKTMENILKDQMKGESDDNVLSKSETVYVELKANGSVGKTTVSDVINIVGKDDIDDYTSLANIENMNGNEKFKDLGGGKIQWENKGKDITYQGTTDKEAPISFDIEYRLDGKKMTAKEIKGKSGHVEIDYKMKNNVKGDEFTPFVVLGALFLDESKFSDIGISKGKITEYGENQIVIGYAIPGLNDYLNKNINDKSDILDKLPVDDGFTVEADVENFALGMGMFICTSNLVDFNIKDAIDLSNIEDKVKQLEDGVNQLTDGTKELASGADKLKDGSNTIYIGARKLSGYTDDLADGTKLLKKKYDTFNTKVIKGTKTLSDGAKKIKKATKDISDGSKTLNDGTGTLKKGVSDLKTGTTQIAAGISKAKEGLEKNDGILNGSKKLKEGTKSANAGVKKIVKTLEDTPGTMKTQIDGVIQKISAATGGAISTEAQLNGTVEAINNAVAGGTNLETVLAAKGLNVNTYYALLQAYYSVQTLESVKKSFSDQISASAEDIGALLDGMDALEQGTSDLNSGLIELDSGITQLNLGAKGLDDGAAKLEKGAGDLDTGTEKLSKGAKATSDGAKSLSDGTTKLYKSLKKNSPKILAAVAKLSNGSALISKGAFKLSDGTKTFNEGMVSLANGTTKLENGVVKLNDQGISKITELFDGKLDNAIDTIQDMLTAGNKYDSFAGKDKGMKGNVKFIFKTEEIGED